jgi:hypothetical protein
MGDPVSHSFWVAGLGVDDYFQVVSGAILPKRFIVKYKVGKFWYFTGELEARSTYLPQDVIVTSMTHK